MKEEFGCVTKGYSADRSRILELLNEARSRELIAYLEYKHFEMIMEGMMMEDMQELCREHASQELGHAEGLGFRIVQLGGVPVVRPSEFETMAKKFNYEFKEVTRYNEMLEDLYEKERIAIDGYRELVKLCGFDDPTTRRLAEDFLKDEEHHADEIYNLIKGKRA
ncbi:MAG: hypothetical protein APU95_03815 [Hadesarchaea archaeon YNP_N21]|nr:MAG: hypothetical protein APU95_03815 [Hadesarchaea archaeon YNP_N21]